jgi:hypothetical protein
MSSVVAVRPPLKFKYIDFRTEADFACYSSKEFNNVMSFVIPHLLVYKIHVVARASEKRWFRDWSYKKGSLIA